MAVTILVVDDSGTDRLIIKNMLAEYDVLLACDGIEALRSIEENEDIDLMILDLNMPNLDGFQVLDILNSDRRNKKLRTIILTNYDELENEIRGLQLGAVDYIRKPIHMESLKARIKIHLELLRAQQQLESKLIEYELTFDTVLEQAPIGIAISQNNNPELIDISNFSSMNRSFELITGRTEEALGKIGWAQITHPEDINEELANFLKLKTGEIESYSMEKRLLKPGGTVVWVNAVVARLSMDKLGKTGYIYLVQDITKRKKAEHALAESERSKSVLLSNLQGMAYRCKPDLEWTMQFVSSGSFKLTGYAPAKLEYSREVSYKELIAPEYSGPLKSEWKRTLDEKLPFSYEYEIITAEGKRKWVLDIGQGVYSDRGEIEALEGIIIDISERKAMESKLRFNSEHDPLTGLYNRRFMESMLTDDLKNQISQNRALVSLNMSAMHSLSMTYGFQHSQNLIKKVASELSTLCTNNRFLFNSNDYSLVYYVKGYADKNELVEFCNEVSRTLNFLLAAERVNVGIGVLEIVSKGEYDIGNLLKNVLVTSEEALHLGDEENHIYFYNKDLEERISRREILQRELCQVSSKAEDNRLFLHYQPILDLRENRICGFEALARYKSDKLGMVPPLEFIPIAEETKHIVTIGSSIIYQACAFVARLNRLGYDSIEVSINISAVQLLNSNFVESLFDTITELSIDPRHIMLELTESVFSAKFDKINNILGQLKTQGIKCSIDDFGTGYSSLSRERELKVDCVKIDKSFINKLMALKTEETITGDIISLTHRLGHCVVAEGVEHQKQLDYLIEHNCDKAQGFLISKPLSEAMAIEFIRDYNKNQGK